MTAPFIVSAAMLFLSAFVLLLIPFLGGERRTKLWLGSMFALNLFVYVFRLALLGEHPASSGLEFVLRYVMWGAGPLAFLYVRDSVYEPCTRDTKRVLAAFFIIALICGTGQLVWYFLDPSVHISYVRLNGVAENRASALASGLSFSGVESVFVYLSHRTLKRYQAQFEGRYSTEALREIRWLRIFTLVCLVWFLLPAANSIARFLVPSIPHILALPLTVVPIGAMFFFAIQHALARPRVLPLSPGEGLLKGQPPGQAPPDDAEVSSGTWQLSTEQRAGIAAALEQALAEDRFYLHPEASLPALAEELGVSTHHLSQVIGLNFDTNFFGLINRYRALEAAELLRDPDRRETTVLEIALRAGFNSKAAFNRAFRRHFDMTPSDYRRAQLPTMGVP